ASTGGARTPISAGGDRPDRTGVQLGYVLAERPVSGPPGPPVRLLELQFHLRLRRPAASLPGLRNAGAAARSLGRGVRGLSALDRDGSLPGGIDRLSFRDRGSGDGSGGRGGRRGGSSVRDGEDHGSRDRSDVFAERPLPPASGAECRS